MKDYWQFVAAIVIVVAECVGAADSPAKMRRLNDQTYFDFVRGNQCLVLVEFCDFKPSGSRAEVLSALGSQTNHIALARVDLSANPILASNWMSGTLGNYEYGVRRNNQRILVTNLPSFLLFLNGTPVECIKVSGGLDQTWKHQERTLVQRLWSEVHWWESRQRKTKDGLNRIPRPRPAEQGEFEEWDEAVIFSVAVGQHEAARRHNYSDFTKSAAEALGLMARTDTMLAVPPALVEMLNDPYRAQSAAHSLAGFGSRAAFAVEPLLKIFGKIEQRRSFSHSPGPNPDDRNLANAVAAAQALGGIGASAVKAEPLLKDYAVRQFKLFSEQRSEHGVVSWEQRAGLVAALALSSIRSEQKPKTIAPKVRVTGTTYHVLGGMQSGATEQPRVAVVFWRHDEIVVTTSDEKGQFEVDLEPGIYACAWTRNFPQVFQTTLFTPDLEEVLYFECKEGATKPLSISAIETVID